MKLYAYDLDDTLINSESKVNLIRDGKHIELTPAEFAVYVREEGDQLNFKQFRTIKGQIDAITLHPMMDIFVDSLFKAVKDKTIHVAIVTAREQMVHSDVLNFFRIYFNYVLGHDRMTTERLIRAIEYKGLNTSDPNAKSDHILGYMEPENKFGFEPLKDIKFYDDSIKNVKAVSSLNGQFGATVEGYVVKDGKPYRYRNTQ